MAMNPKLLRPRASGFDPDALRYITAVQAADGQTLEPAVRNAINDFVVGCKRDGIWSAIKASCILAGARTLAGALVPLAGAAPTNFNFVSGDYNRKTGLKANGSTKYLDANRTGTDDPLNSCHFAVYASTAESANFGAYIGTNSATPNDTSSITRSNTSLSFNNCTVTSIVVSNAGSATGFIGSNRASGTAFEARVSGATSSQSTASGARSSINYFVFGINTGSLSSAGNSRLAFYSIGESLDLSLLDTRVSALYTAIGAAIP